MHYLIGNKLLDANEISDGRGVPLSPHMAPRNALRVPTGNWTGALLILRVAALNKQRHRERAVPANLQPLPQSSRLPSYKSGPRRPKPWELPPMVVVPSLELLEDQPGDLYPWQRWPLSQVF